MREDPTFRPIKFTIKNKNIVNCEYCDKKVKLMGLRVHLQYCLKEKNICSESNCQVILSKESAKYCKAHFYENSDFSNYNKHFTKEGNRIGGLIAAHNRKHVKEELYIEFCEYCKEYCEENKLELTVTKDRLIEFKELNYSNNRIAEIFSVHKKTVSNWLKLAEI